MRKKTRSPGVRAGTVVAITGGARGIGKCTAEAFLAEGAVVALGDIDTELVVETAVELEKRSGARVIGLPLNVTDPESFAAFLDAAEERLGPVDVVINNAGIMPTGLFSDEEAAMTARMVDINVYGVLHGSRLAVQRFSARGSGQLVNVASLAGATTLPGLATYCGTKRFVMGFTETLQQELLNTGIDVTLVQPGVVRTELSAGTRIPKWMSGMSTVDPEEVASGIVDAVSARSLRAVVPASLGYMLKGLSLLPSKAQYRVMHAIRLDIGAVDVDPVARARYHSRLVGGDS